MKHLILSLACLCVSLVPAFSQGFPATLIDEQFTPTEIINAPIVALAVAPDGGAYIGGDFTQISGNATYRYLAKINPDGSLDTTFNPNLTGPVTDIKVQPDQKIIVSGDFEEAAGQLSRDLARFLPDGSPDTAFNTNIGEGSNGFIAGIDLLPGGFIVVAGQLSSWSGTSLGTNRDLLLLNSSGSLLALYSKGFFTPSLTNVLALPTGEIIVSYDTNTAISDKAALFGTDLNIDSSFRHGRDFSQVLSIRPTQAGNLLFAGTDSRVINLDGSLQTLLPGPSNDLIQQQDGKILAAEANLTRFLPNGTADPDFPAQFFNSGGQANILAPRPDGRIWVAGDFTSYQGITASRIFLLQGDPILLAISTQPESLVLDPGDTATFSISAAGETAISYQWEKNGTPLSDDPRFSGTQSPTLEILNITDLDEASYTCTVTNEAGSEVSEEATLTVLGLPEFLLQPQSNTLVAGDIATLTSEVIGLGNLTFQWEKNGTPISSATTETLVISPTRLSDTGTYQLIVTNALGSTSSQLIQINVSSNPATLVADFTPPTLNDSVLAMQPLENGAVLIGGSFTIVTDGTTSGGPHLAVIESDGRVRDLPNLSADATVRAINLDADGNFLLAGDFNEINGTFRSRAARLLPNFSLDPSFDVGSGPNGILFNIRQDPNGKIHIGGTHTVWNGSTDLSYHLRLNQDGTVDPLFTSLANNWVHDAIPLSDGTVIVGGSASNPDGDNTTTSDNNLYRINGDGTFDPTFEGDVNFNSPTKLLVDASGRIYTNSPFGNILKRFLSDGSLDDTFPDQRTNGTVTSMFLDSQGRLLVGGNFTTVDQQEQVRLVRFLPDDSIDLGFQSFSGPDNAIQAFAENPDGSLWIGGDFTTFQGASASHLVRINGGEAPSVDPLDDYLIAAGVSEESREPNDDPDRDGIPNVLEFIYNSNPLEARDVLQNASQQIINGADLTGADLDPEKNYYLLNLRLPKDTKGYTLTPEASLDLISFDPESAQLIPHGDPVDDGDFVNQAYYFLPDQGTAPRVFWRMRATQ